MAIEPAAAATRRYVKRQTTWFRGQADGFTRLQLFGEEDGMDRLAAALGAPPFLREPCA
jgi:tRNA A37 N6-isopentenylltransferase MiaA